MKNKRILFGIGIVFLFLASVGFSYAYFKSTIVNNNVKDQIVTTGTLELTYTDGPEIKMLNIKPGQTITKKVIVKNTGTLDTSYNLVWQELNNTIINDEMVISATCKRLNANSEEEGTCEVVNETPVKESIIKKNVSIEPNIVHQYDITIAFKEINAAQNYNQGKTFSGVLGINEYKKIIPEPVYCTYDGELTQGTEYVNGQYTYKYKQEYAFDEQIGDILWTNINIDGWGVQLTDKESTDAVTSKVCTYINNKPIVSMSYMFYSSQATTVDVSNFNTSEVKNMSSMFESSQATTLDLSSFDTSNVTDMSGMFNDSQATTIDLSGFDTSNVTNMGGMFGFSQASKIKGLNNFNPSKVTDMSGMFNGSQATTLNVSNFDTGKVTDMSWMFSYSLVKTIDLSNFDTSNVNSMSSMFYDSQATTLDLSSFDTSNVIRMVEMFSRSTNLKTIYASNKFNVNAVTDSSNMFNSCLSLVGGAGTKYDSTKIDKTYARIDGGTSSPGYFTLKN